MVWRNCVERVLASSSAASMLIRFVRCYRLPSVTSSTNAQRVWSRRCWSSSMSMAMRCWIWAVSHCCRSMWFVWFSPGRNCEPMNSPSSRRRWCGARNIVTIIRYVWRCGCCLALQPLKENSFFTRMFRWRRWLGISWNTSNSIKFLQMCWCVKFIRWDWCHTRSSWTRWHIRLVDELMGCHVLGALQLWLIWFLRRQTQQVSTPETYHQTQVEWDVPGNHRDVQCLYKVPWIPTDQTPHWAQAAAVTLRVGRLTATNKG